MITIEEFEAMRYTYRIMWLNYARVYNKTSLTFIRILRQRDDFRYLKNPLISMTRGVLFKTSNNPKELLFEKVKDDSGKKEELDITKKNFFTTSQVKREALDEFMVSNSFSTVYGLTKFRKFIRLLCKIRVGEETKSFNENPDQNIIKYFDEKVFVYVPDLNIFLLTAKDNAIHSWFDARRADISVYYLELLVRIRDEALKREKYMYINRNKYKKIVEENNPLDSDLVDIWRSM